MIWGKDMFNPTNMMAESFGEHIATMYSRYFEGRRPEYASYLRGASMLILERIGNSDALYHNAEHTMMVTLVGQEIIRGRLVSEALLPEDWLHYIFALLLHDVGYVRGIVPGDGEGSVVIDAEGNRFTPPRGSSDAVLAPYHVDRAMLYVRDRFRDSSFIDAERLASAIEYTRFPVPNDARFQQDTGEGALVRAADLIGQLGDPFYHRKINALYYEFEETGVAKQLGYETPSDVLEKYPDFFWEMVHPYIGPALSYLEQTVEGKQWIAQLYNHVFQVHHRSNDIGPFPGA